MSFFLSWGRPRKRLALLMAGVRGGPLRSRRGVRCTARGWPARANMLLRSAPCHLGTESPTSPSPSLSSKLSLYVALFSVQQLQVLIEAIDQFTSAVNTQLALRLPGVCNGVVMFPSHAVLIDVPH